MAALLYELLPAAEPLFSLLGKEAVPSPDSPPQDLCGAQKPGLGGQFREMVRHPGLWRLTVQVPVLGPHLPAV